ncbi:membrane protein, partial [Pontibacter sp. HJ8]
MKRLYSLAFLLFYFLLPVLCNGQLKYVPLETGPAAKVKKKAPSQQMHLDFPNLNKISYYNDRKKLSEIQRLEKRKQYAQALPLLEAYVRNFGIENFYKNTKLLWRLGQLYERQDKLPQAMEVYRLALKHHRTDIRQIQSYYDSLEQNTKDYYVPLSYYYELVEYRKSLTTYKPPRGVYLNMGNGINSPYEDYGPTLGADNNTLLFTSKRNIQGLTDKPNEDLYYANKSNEFWSEAQSFGKPINSIYNEGSACLSRDGKTLYFARCESPDGFGNCDLYKATLQPDGTWHEIENLGASVNTSAWDSQPTLSPNEDTLYFASDRLGGFGLSDIYYTYKQQNGNWAPARNMGPIVNTRQSEVSPFFHPLYQVLYFSSRG